MPDQTSRGSLYRPRIAQREVTSGSYTIVRADSGQDVNMNNASAQTVTVPPFTLVGFEPGEYVNIHQTGAGQVTIVAAPNVTINTPETLLIAKQYGVVTLENKGTNVWNVFGNLEAA